MTIFTELPSTVTPPNDEFAPVAEINVGDEFQGETGRDYGFADIPRDLTDTILINLVEGTTYSFDLIKSNVSDTLEMTISTGGAPVTFVTTTDPDNPGVTTFTFTASATGYFEMEVSGYSFGFTGGPDGTPIGLLGPTDYTLALVAAELPGPTDGDDVLLGGDAPTTIDLMDGDDTWTGVDDPDAFVPGQYIDSITGGAGNDTIYSGIGNDSVDGGRDNDEIHLGDGNDNGWGGEGDDLIFGGTGRDIINGNSGDDELYGGKGGDLMRGGKGEDLIFGGNQSDEIYGGSQSDEIHGGTGNDDIFGDEGSDLIYGGSGNDKIDGGKFDDEIYGGHGQDMIVGGSGDDEAHGGVSNDRVNGNSGDDILFGGKGNDNLSGGTGNDQLFGGSQADRLFGGDGDDILNGGLGQDDLFGGTGADTFVFEGVVNHNIIRDFEAGVDTVDLTAYGPITIEDVMDAVSVVGSNTLIDLGENGSILLTGVTLADLSLDDFDFLVDLGEDGLDVPLPPEIIEVG